MENSIKQSQILLNNYNNKIRTLRSKIDINKTLLRVVEESLDDLLIRKDFSKAKDLIERTVSAFLDNRKDILITSIVTVMQCIQFDPNKEFLTRYEDNNLVGNNDYACSKLNKLGYYLDFKKVEDYLNTYHLQILDLANMLYDRILKIVQHLILYTSRFSV